MKARVDDHRLESPDFDHISTLSGRRTAGTPNGNVVFHYGNPTDDDDPRWFVTSLGVAMGIYFSLADIVCRVDGETSGGPDND